MSALGLAVAAILQPAPAAAPAPAEIVVTGERADRRLRDTASSVAVFRADELAAIPSADRLDDILLLVPNVQLGNGGLAPAIRGQDSTGVLRDLPAFLGGNRPRVALQIDGRPADYNELVFGLASLWDVDQVEVYRSPQSTTQGVNSIAGAIFITTRDPSFENEAKARLAIGSARRRQASAMLTGPLLGDQLAFRLAGDWGRQRPLARIVDRMRGADPDIDKQALVRLKLLARPDALPGSRFELGLSHVTSQAPQVELIRRPFEARRDPLAGYGIFRTRINALTSEAHLALSPTVQSLTTATAAWSDIRRFAPPGLGEARNERRQWSAESLLRWRPSGAFRLQGGFHLLDSDLDQAIDLDALRVGFGRFHDAQRAIGLFGESEWRPAPRLLLIGGIRWQHDRQRRDGLLTNEPSVTKLDIRHRFRAWLPKLSLAFEASDALTAGVLVQKAANPGGATFNLLGFNDRFDPERLWGFELFARGRLARGRLRYSLNLFRNRFEDAQRLQIEQVAVGGVLIPISQLGNVPKARARGAELELDWRASESLGLRAGLGLLDTRIDRTRFAADPLLGKQFARAPHHSVSAAIDWRPASRLRLSAQLRGHSGYFSNDPNTPDLRIDGAVMADARAAWDVGRFTVSGYARNLFDRFALTSLLSSTSATAAAPRELGLELEARF